MTKKQEYFLDALIQRMDENNTLLTSHRKLAAELGLCPRSVQNFINTLIKNGVITCETFQGTKITLRKDSATNDTK